MTIKRVCVLVLVLGGCIPQWKGQVPPIVARQDPCGTGALTADGVQVLRRLPYLQSPRYDGVTVAWATVPNTPSRVVVARERDADRAPIARGIGAPVGPDLDGTLAAQFAPYDDSDVGGEPEEAVAEEPIVTERRQVVAVNVGSLPAEDTGYCYRIESNGYALTEWASLTLAPSETDDRVDRFVILGDVGNGQPAQRAIASQIANQPMDAVIFLGDLAYTSGTDGELQTRFFDIYADLFQRVPVYAAIGNHDNRTDRGRPFEEAFLLPGNERWYSFDLGDVHFVTLDTTRIGREQAAWLEQDLAATHQKFVVVLGHHPPFTSSRRGGNKDFQRWFVPILERHHVELVLTGHEHQYERTKVIGGIVYIVSGGGGARLSHTGWNRQQQVARAKHHYLTLEAHRDQLVVRAIGIDGKQIDQVVIVDRG